MAYEYDVPSWFRTRMFLLPYVDSDTIPASAGAADEITSIIDHDLGKFEKDYKEYRMSLPYLTMVLRNCFMKTGLLLIITN